VIADGGYRGTGLIIPHRHERDQDEVPTWKEEANAPIARSEPASSTPSHPEDAEDPPRLPPEGRGRSPRRARHRPPPQPHPHRVRGSAAGSIGMP
jgi:hypothetical protein